MKSTILQRCKLLLLGCIAFGFSASVQAQNLNETEVTAQRSESSKTFRQSNGSYRAQIFSSPVHFADENGQWKDIDPRLQPSPNPAYAFENTANTTRSFFPKTLQANGVKIETAEGAFEMGNRFEFTLDMKADAVPGLEAITVDLNQAEAQLADGNKVRYDGGHPLGYVEYLVQRNQVKQQFILKQLPAGAMSSSAKYFSMSETFALPQGWSLLADGEAVTGSATTSGALQIQNAEGKVVGGIPLPEIFEQQANGELLFPNGAMDHSYFIQRAPGTNEYLIKILIPMNWLRAPGRSFPIVIDPNTVISGTWG
ncbi:MAG: hypothetical protein AAF570_12745, partial [Bacteroidota bacterium]